MNNPKQIKKERDELEKELYNYRIKIKCNSILCQNFLSPDSIEILQSIWYN